MKTTKKRRAGREEARNRLSERISATNEHESTRICLLISRLHLSSTSMTPFEKIRVHSWLKFFFEIEFTGPVSQCAPEPDSKGEPSFRREQGRRRRVGLSV